MTRLRYALNHMIAPAMPLPAFFDLAASLGIEAVEIRNDMAGNAILDGTPAGEIRRIAEDRRIRIISINALQRFNEWTPERAKEAAGLIAYARECGAEALVLVPVNDGSGKVDGERQSNLRTALSALKPMLKDAGVTGLVEPLGFEICSLRSKSEAVEAISDIEGPFKLVHDTFHHHLAHHSPADPFADESGIFPALTGLVHISGVSDPDVAVGEMRDPHRILVDARDRLQNAGQISALLKGGYQGYFSFEPFAPSVHALADPAAALRASMAHLDALL